MKKFPYGFTERYTMLRNGILVFFLRSHSSNTTNLVFAYYILLYQHLVAFYILEILEFANLLSTRFIIFNMQSKIWSPLDIHTSLRPYIDKGCCPGHDQFDQTKLPSHHISGPTLILKFLLLNMFIDLRMGLTMRPGVVQSTIRPSTTF